MIIKVKQKILFSIFLLKKRLCNVSYLLNDLGFPNASFICSNSHDICNKISSTPSSTLSELISKIMENFGSY